MSSPVFPPELFTLIGVNVFVALSLLTSLFDSSFPTAVPYVYQIAALAGFGQIWVNYAFLFLSVEARFWCSLPYLSIALISVIAVNIYIAIYKKPLTVAVAFLGGATIPTVLVSFLSVSAYVNGLLISMPPLPIVPIELVYAVLATCIVILVLSIGISLDPSLLRKATGIGGKHRSYPSSLYGSSKTEDDFEENKRE